MLKQCLVCGDTYFDDDDDPGCPTCDDYYADLAYDLEEDPRYDSFYE
jgi:hypothetical protein